MNAFRLHKGATRENTKRYKKRGREERKESGLAGGFLLYWYGSPLAGRVLAIIRIPG